ncbi:hypothetical protein WICMUC_005775 [Wickerhamomyces mucosus]|uniref:Uncharacterized protein n=1 Tax=Wickerhamomyces mucosus TaxID=1378264 RepID=A0A9P8P3G7_9ASCO|nr:hypothetical protein WICMUC_005775 [Wickerhamomyces mucosus]
MNILKTDTKLYEKISSEKYQLDKFVSNTKVFMIRNDVCTSLSPSNRYNIISELLDLNRFKSIRMPSIKLNNYIDDIINESGDLIGDFDCDMTKDALGLKDQLQGFKTGDQCQSLEGDRQAYHNKLDKGNNFPAENVGSETLLAARKEEEEQNNHDVCDDDCDDDNDNFEVEEEIFGEKINSGNIFNGDVEIEINYRIQSVAISLPQTDVISPYEENSQINKQGAPLKDTFGLGNLDHEPNTNISYKAPQSTPVDKSDFESDPMKQLKELQTRKLEKIEAKHEAQKNFIWPSTRTNMQNKTLSLENYQQDTIPILDSDSHLRTSEKFEEDPLNALYNEILQEVSHSHYKNQNLETGDFHSGTSIFGQEIAKEYKTPMDYNSMNINYGFKEMKQSITDMIQTFESMENLPAKSKTALEDINSDQDDDNSLSSLIQNENHDSFDTIDTSIESLVRDLKPLNSLNHVTETLSPLSKNTKKNSLKINEQGIKFGDIKEFFEKINDLPVTKKGTQNNIKKRLLNSKTINDNYVIYESVN